MISNCKDNNGFSLVELLVSITIIGILASLSVALFENYRERANHTTALSSLRNGITSLEALRADYGANPTFFANFQEDMTFSITMNNFVSGSPITTDLATLPGYSHNEGVVLTLESWGDSSPFKGFPSTIRSTHCKGKSSAYLAGSGYSFKYTWEWYSNAGLSENDRHPLAFFDC